MKGLTPGQIAKACQGIYYGPEAIRDTEVTAVTTDSRKIEKGCLFAALKGSRVDGHSFVPAAYEQGASCALVEDPAADLLLAGRLKRGDTLRVTARGEDVQVCPSRPPKMA